MFKGVMTAIRSVLTRIGARGLAAGLAVLVLPLCVVSVAPAPAAEAGCSSADASPKLCSQSGVSDPLLAVAPQVPPIEARFAPAVGLFASSHPRPAVSLHAGPAAPRAPPFSLT
ncbi:MAG: hypothetical protein ACRDH5_09130 [bacterium]